MDDLHVSPKRKLGRILTKSGITQDQFNALLRLNFNQAIEAVHITVSGEKSKFGIAERANIDQIPLPPIFEKNSWDDNARAKQIFIDRIFMFYLMTACHSMPETEFQTRVSIKGRENLEQYLANDRSVIFLNSHYGPGQIVQIVLARLGIELTTLSAKNFYEVLGIHRANLDVFTLTGSFSAQALAKGMEVLSSGGAIHLTGDGYSGDSGRNWNFFGRARTFPRGFAYMALKSNAVILPVLTSIDEKAHITLSINRAINPDKFSGDRQQIMDAMTGQYIKTLKKAWRQDPANIPFGTLQKYDKLPKFDRGLR